MPYIVAETVEESPVELEGSLVELEGSLVEPEGTLVVDSALLPEPDSALDLVEPFAALRTPPELQDCWDPFRMT